MQTSKKRPFLRIWLVLVALLWAWAAYTYMSADQEIKKELADPVEAGVLSQEMQTISDVAYAVERGDSRGAQQAWARGAQEVELARIRSRGEFHAKLRKRRIAEDAATLGPIAFGLAILVLKWILKGFGIPAKREEQAFED
jgi:hypothetical protein